MERLAIVSAWVREFLSKRHAGLWRAMFVDRRAVTSIEYCMIALIIILGIILGANRIGGQLAFTFNNVSNEL